MRWEAPKMKMWSVKMDESIAASGTGQYEIGLIGIHHGNGQNVYDQQNYRYDPIDGRIQDTNVKYVFLGDGVTKAVNENQAGRIGGCLA